jgi:hypothetical protein
MVAPHRRLLEHVVNGACQHHALDHRKRYSGGRFADGLLVHGERDVVLHAGEVVAHRVPGAVMGIELGGRVERPRLDLGRLQCRVHVISVRCVDDRHPEGRCDGHGVAASIGCGGADDLQSLGIVLWSMRESGEPCVTVTPAVWPLMWSGIQYESTRLATAPT